MFVKICGVTRPDDASAAASAGADAIGLNFVPTSRRCIDTETARAILAAIADTPERVMTVGVFRDHTLGEISDIVHSLKLDAVQLHGDESPAFAAAVAEVVGTVIKVVAPDPAAVAKFVNEPSVDIIMFDAPTPGGGVPVDWDVIGDLVASLPVTTKVLLAGGLTPDNVATAIKRVRPWGVDVATGVEDPTGRKDSARIAGFIAAAEAAQSPPQISVSTPT